MPILYLRAFAGAPLHKRSMVTSNTIVPLKLDFAAEKGGHGRLGRVETGPLARTLPIGTKEHNNAHRRDALCPSTKIQKQAAFGISRPSAGDRSRLAGIGGQK